MSFLRCSCIVVSLLVSCGDDLVIQEPNEAPIAQMSAARNKALILALDSEQSRDPDGSIAFVHWDFGDGQESTETKVEHQYTEPGCYTVTLKVEDNEGATNETSRVLRIIDAIEDTPTSVEVNGLPKDGAFLARDLETNKVWIRISGTTPTSPFETVSLRLSKNDQIESEIVSELCSESFDLELPLEAELENRRIEVVFRGLNNDWIAESAERVVAGDVILINGQSNAFARVFPGSEGQAEENRSEFVRSFGFRTEDVDLHLGDSEWRLAEVGGLTEESAAVGQWPLRMASQLSEQFGLPIAIINGARGGRPIDYFQRNSDNRENLETNYGRLLERSRRAGVQEHVRAMLFYQGESDRDNADVHRQGFVELHEHWREDYPSIEHYYVTQIRNGCGGQVVTREVQRRFAEELPNTQVMTTTGLEGHDGCHFSYENGYRELGDWYAELLARDLYGMIGQEDLEGVNVASATFEGNSIRIQTSSDASALFVDDGMEDFFDLPGSSRSVESVRVEGLDIVLELSAGSDPSVVSYNGHPGPGPWITNAKGRGLLAFQIEIE